MITLNERNLGNFSPESAQAAVAYLQGKGYACEYGPFTEKTPKLEDLPPAQQIALLQDAISYLTDKYLCPALFGEAAQ